MPTSSPVPLNLAGSINAAYAQAGAQATDAKQNARIAVERALECGQLMTRQKRALPHGAWQTWLATNCPTISAPTARRYMMLARRAPHSELTAAGGLRQAYLATGVLTVSKKSRQKQSATTPIVTFTRGLDQFRRWYHTRTENNPISKWSAQSRRLLQTELSWFKKLHDDLGV